MLTTNNFQEKLKLVQTLFGIDPKDVESFIADIVTKEVAKRLEERKEPSIEETFSVKQAATKIGLSESTLRRCIKSGELRHFRIGKKGKLILIKQSDLQALLVERKLKGTR